MIIMEVVVMRILASCDIDRAIGFNGKLVLPNEDEKKPDKVMLNIVVGGCCGYSNEEVFQKASNLGKDIVQCITFKVEEGRFASYASTEWEGKIFNEYSAGYYDDPNVPVCDKVTSLLRLPEGYSNMRVLYDMSKKYPNVRYIGGHLLGIEGIRIGRFDTGKDKMSPVFKDMYDSFVEVDLDDLNGIQEIVKKTRKKAEGLEAGVKKPRVKRSGSKAKAEKKPPKRLVAFNSLFSGDEEDEF